MSIDLLSFVDSRVTLIEHPINELLRNAIQSKFSESKDEMKLHIGREGINYRLVSKTHKENINYKTITVKFCSEIILIYLFSSFV